MASHCGRRVRDGAGPGSHRRGRCGRPRIDWQEHGLSRSFPGGIFDLVFAQLLHSPLAGAGEPEAILASASAAVGPGGTLLVIGHAGRLSWLAEPPLDFRLPMNSEVLATLAAGPGEWAVDTDEVLTRELTGPAGEVGTRDDTVLRAHRPIDVRVVVVTWAGHRRWHGAGPVPAGRLSPDDRAGR